MAGQVIQRGDRTWLLRVYMGVVDGKRKYINRTVHGTKRDAQSVLNKLLTDRDSGSLTMPTKVTLDSFITQWAEKALRGRVTPRTYDGYLSAYTAYLKPTLGGRRMTAITAWDIQAVYSGMLARSLSARTVRHAHAVLRNALKQAVRWQIIASNPADSVDLPKASQEQKFRALTPQQITGFLASIADSPWKAVYHLMLNTGLRPGEVFGLGWSDVDLARCELVVRQAVTFDHGKVPILSVPKTKKARRVTFTQELAQVLLQHQEATRGIVNPLQLVFTTIDGELIHPNNWSKRDLKSALKRAGLPAEVRLYDLRHSMATLALQAGIHPKVVSERLGHSTTRLTLDTYSHVTPHMQDQAGESLAKLIYRPAVEADRKARIN